MVIFYSHVGLPEGTREWNNSGRIALILGARDEWLGSLGEYSTVATYAD